MSVSDLPYTVFELDHWQPDKDHTSITTSKTLDLTLLLLISKQSVYAETNQCTSL